MWVPSVCIGHVLDYLLAVLLVCFPGVHRLFHVYGVFGQLQAVFLETFIALELDSRASCNVVR